MCFITGRSGKFRTDNEGCLVKLIKKICQICGVKFLSQKSNKGLYCSRKCVHKSLEGKFVGEKSPTWKGGWRIKGSLPYKKNMNRILAYNREIRQAVLRILGYKCSKCGYDKDWRALQIDHISGGGKKDIMGLSLYRKIIKEGAGDTYQLLCANCNFIKRYENNELNQHKGDQVG